MCPILLADSFTYASFDVHVTSHIDVIYIWNKYANRIYHTYITYSYEK